MFGERKSELLTMRLTDEEVEILESLSDRTGKSKSDVISRACMFFLHSQVNDIYDDLGRSLYGRSDSDRGGITGVGSGRGLNCGVRGCLLGSGTDERRARMTVRVHARLPESMVNRLRDRGTESGESLSQVVRRAIRAFDSANIIPY